MAFTFLPHNTDPATPLLLYCHSGMACHLLQLLGYTQVRNGGGVGVLSMQLGRPIRRTI